MRSPLFVLPLLVLASGCARTSSVSPEDASLRSATADPSTATRPGVAPSLLGPIAAASSVAASVSSSTHDAGALGASFLPLAPAVDLPTSLRDAAVAEASALHQETVRHVDSDAYVVEARRAPNEGLASVRQERPDSAASAWDAIAQEGPDRLHDGRDARYCAPLEYARPADSARPDGLTPSTAGLPREPGTDLRPTSC